MSKKLPIGFVGILATLAMLGAMGGTARAGGEVSTAFDCDNFPADPTIIDNPYWPLNPSGEAQTFVYHSETEDGCEVNKVIVDPNATEGPGFFGGEYACIKALEVVDKVWLVEDKDCSEVTDGDLTDDTLSESTLDWYAQDIVGNVWYFGEDTCEILESGECDTAGSWTAGEDVADIGSPAVPGVIILAAPTPGDFYQQEFYEGEAEDLGKVTRLNARVSLVLDHNDALIGDEYDGCMKTKEWSPLERGAIEYKSYCPEAPGGLVLIEEHMGKTVRTELVDIVVP
jgi:hypothetical protein